jgi:hypothetical protein
MNKLTVRKIGMCVLGLAALAAAGAAQGQSQPFIRHSFEENEGGWTVFGPGTKVSRTTEAADVKEGKAALKLEYTIEKGTMGAMLLPTPNGELTKARAIRFWVKADYAAPVVISLQEKGNEGRYLSMFAAPAGKWQQVELSPGDFFLSEDANDPKDPNNKLDLDAVESIGVLDVAQMFAQAEPAVAAALGIKMGVHHLYLDDFSVSAEPLGPAAAVSDAEIKLDPMTRPQVSWFGIGVGSLTMASGAPLEGKSLQVDYHGAPMKPAGFIKRFPRGKLIGMDKIVFNCASVKPAKVLVQLEERGGGKYSVMVDVPGGKTPKEISVKFSEMLEADDSKDSNGKLDLAEVQQLVLMDLLAWIEMSERDNTLWIGGLKASK